MILGSESAARRWPHCVRCVLHSGQRAGRKGGTPGRQNQSAQVGMRGL